MTLASEINPDQLKQWVGRRIKVMPNGSGYKMPHGQVAKLVEVDTNRGKATVLPPGHKHTEEVALNSIHLWASDNPDLSPQLADPWVIYDLGHERFFESPSRGWTTDPQKAKGYDSRTGARRAAGHLKQHRAKDISEYGLTIERRSKATLEMNKIRNRRAAKLEEQPRLPERNGHATVQNGHATLPKQNDHPPSEVEQAMAKLMDRMKDVHEAERMLEQCRADLQTAQEELMDAVRRNGGAS